MSIASKLLSAALTAGTVLAVGYGLKKLSDKVPPMQPQPEETTDDAHLFGTANSKINLKVGDENEWSYTMRKKGIVKESENQSDNTVHQFNFIPLKDGVTELEFDYKPKGSKSAKKTITYNIEVKNGKMIRCDAAGDLEMIQK